MQWPEPAHTEQSLARLARPTKGGAVRIRIALGTAVAVVAVPASLFAVFSSSSAASTRLTRHEANSHHRTVKINDTLMSYAQARAAATMVTYADAVEAGQVKTYLTEIAYLKAVAAHRNSNKSKKLRRKRQRRPAAAAQARAVAVAAPASAPRRSTRDATSTNTADWACIRQHESGGNYAVGNEGAYQQFRIGTWHGLTGHRSPRLKDYPAAVQDARRTEAVFPARLGALDHPVHLRAVKTEPSMGFRVSGARIEDNTEHRFEGLHTTGRTPCGDMPERTTPSTLAVRGANAHLAGARPHRAEPGVRPSHPRRRGGAVRIPHCSSRRRWPLLLLSSQLYFMSLFSSGPAWAQATRHRAVGSHQGAALNQSVRINDKLMSYSQARQVARMVTYAEAAQQATFFKDLAFFQAVATQGADHPGRMDGDRRL